jgi:hypothetical protein
MINLTLHLDDLSLPTHSEETFDDLIMRQQYRKGPLVELIKLRRSLADNEAVEVSIAGKTPSTQIEVRNLEMLFNKAGLAQVNYDDSDTTPLVNAVKRPLYTVPYDYGLVLKEFIEEEDVLKCHDFARKVYYYKDFNYDYDVTRQFDPNADVFAVVNSKEEILALGRSVIRLPGYTCPFMHGAAADGSRYTIPDRFVRVCEVMGLYVEGREGVVAFKKLMESLTQYAYYIARVDSIWTTFDEVDTYTGTYYRRKLLMESAGIKLTYRDFGGLWNLIFTDKIDELKDVYENMFAR